MRELIARSRLFYFIYREIIFGIYKKVGDDIFLKYAVSEHWQAYLYILEATQNWRLPQASCQHDLDKRIADAALPQGLTPLCTPLSGRDPMARLHVLLNKAFEMRSFNDTSFNLLIQNVLVSPQPLKNTASPNSSSTCFNETAKFILFLVATFMY